MSDQPTSRPPEPKRRLPIMQLAFGVALLLILVDYGFMRSDVEKLRSEFDAMPRNAPTTQDVQDLTKKVGDLADELDAARTEISESKGKVDELEAKIEESEDGLKKLRAERDAAQKEAASKKRR